MIAIEVVTPQLVAVTKRRFLRGRCPGASATAAVCAARDCWCDPRRVSATFSRMAAANASARGQRSAILASPLRDLTGFYLAVDCLASGRGGELSYAVAELASFYGARHTVGNVLRRIRCSGGAAGNASAGLNGRRSPGPVRVSRYFSTTRRVCAPCL
jgi:hypothetical protein